MFPNRDDSSDYCLSLNQDTQSENTRAGKKRKKFYLIQLIMVVILFWNICIKFKLDFRKNLATFYYKANDRAMDVCRNGRNTRF